MQLIYLGEAAYGIGDVSDAFRRIRVSTECVWMFRSVRRRMRRVACASLCRRVRHRWALLWLGRSLRLWSGPIWHSMSLLDVQLYPALNAVLLLTMRH